MTQSKQLNMPVRDHSWNCIYSKLYNILINMYPILTKSLQYYKDILFIIKNILKYYQKALSIAKFQHLWDDCQQELKNSSDIHTPCYSHLLVLLHRCRMGYHMLGIYLVLVLSRWHCQGIRRILRLEIPASTRSYGMYSGDKFLLPANGIFWYWMFTNSEPCTHRIKIGHC